MIDDEGGEFHKCTVPPGLCSVFGLPLLFRTIPVVREGTTHISYIVVWDTPSAPMTANISAITFEAKLTILVVLFCSIVRCLCVDYYWSSVVS